MDILITGCAGFIGSHLLEKLKTEGHSVVGIDNYFHSCRNKEWRKEHKIEKVDIRDNIDEYVRDCDIVFHCAAIIHVDYSIKYPRETIDINVNGTLNVLEAVNKYKKEMVFASSSEVYGSSQSNRMDESHPLDCQSPYAASKVAGDRLCKAFYDTYGTKVAILRNFNTFGPYQADDSYGGVIAIFTRRALLGEDLPIFGSGTQERDYMWIDDAIRGYELCVEKKLWGETINIGSGKTISINDLAELIIKITGSKSKIVHIAPRPGEVIRLCADTSKAEKLGFKSKTNFTDNLIEYVQFYKGTFLQAVRK